MPSPAVAPVVARLARLRARLKYLALVKGTARVVLLAVGLLAASFFADVLLDLPLGVRRFLRLGLLDRPENVAPWAWLPALVVTCAAAALAVRRRVDGVASVFAFLAAGAVGVLAWAVVRFTAGPLRARPSDDALALRVEERFRTLEDRVAAALDFDRELARPQRGESAAMMTRVVAEAGEAVRGVEVDAVASSRPAGRRAALAALAAAAFAGLLLAMPATAALWARRSIALEDVAWPRRTTVVAVVRDAAGNEGEQPPSERYVAALGQSLTVLARARGEAPDDVEILDRVAGEEGGKALAHRMRPVQGAPGLYEHEFRDVRGDFTFALRGGDDRDEEPVWSVSVRVPPRVVAVRCDLHFPAYLALPSRRVEGGALTVPEGTHVAVTFEADAAVAAAEAFVDEKEVPLEPVAGGPVAGTASAPAWRLRFDAVKSLRYRLRIVTKDGRENDGATDTYEVAVLPDAAPRPEWVWPRTPVETSPNGRVPLFARTTDDHGIASMALETRLSAGGESKRIELRPRAGGSVAESNDRPYVSTEILTYVPVEVAGLKDAQGAPPSAASRVQVRLVAFDTKGQEGAGEWASIDVVRPDEIERRLAGQRASVRTDVEGVLGDLAKLRDEAAPYARESIADADRSALRDVQFKQSKSTGDLDRAARSIAGFFHHYAYDRLAAEGPTEKVLSILDRRHRTLFARPEGAPSGDAEVEPFPWSLYAEVAKARRDRVVFDTGVLDKMLSVVDAAVEVVTVLAPAAQAAAAEAASRAGGAEVAAYLEAVEKLRAGLTAMVSSMDEWQGLSEMILALKRLIEAQQVVNDGIGNLPAPK